MYQLGTASRIFRGLIFSIVLIGFPLFSVASEQLRSSVKVQTQIDKNASGSQRKIDQYANETEKLLADYKLVLRKTDSLRIYDDHLEKLVRSQNEEAASLRKQLHEIDTTNQGVIPLMVRMVDTLEQFVRLDVPFLLKERNTRVENLKELMDRADVTVSEKYRRVMEAYQVEMEYGRTIEAYRGPLNIGGVETTVDFLRVGRVALIYQSLDKKMAGVWNQEIKNWQSLPDDFRTPITKGLRIAKRQAAPDLLKLPIAAPEVAQ